MSGAEDEFDPEAYIRSVAPTLGLKLEAGQIPGIAVFLSIAKDMAETLDAAPVTDGTLDLASVFDAGQAMKPPLEKG